MFCDAFHVGWSYIISFQMSQLSQISLLFFFVFILEYSSSSCRGYLWPLFQEPLALDSAKFFWWFNIWILQLECILFDTQHNKSDPNMAKETQNMVKFVWRVCESVDTSMDTSDSSTGPILLKLWKSHHISKFLFPIHIRQVCNNKLWFVTRQWSGSYKAV